METLEGLTPRTEVQNPVRPLALPIMNSFQRINDGIKDVILD